MLTRPAPADNAPPAGRWIAPPLRRDSPAWIDLDARLAADHLARRIDRVVAALDLGPLYRSYAGRGRDAYDPATLLRIALYETYAGQPSPGRWAVDCRESEPLRWLAFGLGPPRTCLYEFRDRLGPLLEALNAQVLAAAIEQGWTTAARAALDGTTVAAAGSRHRLVGAEALRDRLRRLEEAEAAAAASASGGGSPPAESPPAESPARSPRRRRRRVGRTAAARRHQRRTWRRALELLERRIARDPAPSRRARRAESESKSQSQSQSQSQSKPKPKSKSQSKSGSKSQSKSEAGARRPIICPSEPEAALGYDKLGTFRPLYNVQWATDLDSRFLLAYDVVAAVTDAGQLGPLLDRAERLCRRRPAAVVVDGKYASHLDLALCRARGITPYAPVAEPKPADGPAGPRVGAKGLIAKQEFAWDAEAATYRCPRGHALERVGTSAAPRQGGGSVRFEQYRCPPEHCRACPLRAACTRSPERGRVVKRSEHEELAERLRARMGTEAGRAMYALRKQTVERDFAELKAHRGLVRFRGFGLARARAQVGLLVLAWNGLALLAARGTPAAAGAA